ncbi:DoxX family protein [Variovorax terrae]|uniref:DoxX family protein n=1 Tax=Variovorax terrae TaxID=2923278 RepID=A0A9X2ASN5_9BURK|nr:DoxX family protein [Variovorax terrae]MCJ0765576.1 DoxX family protein [Variovorax terrae]
MNTSALAASASRPLAAARSTSSLSATLLDDAGKLLLRVSVAFLVLLHGLDKLGTGPGFVVGALQRAGLPGGLGYLVYVGEVLAPLLVIAGVWTRAAAGVIAFNMLVAFGLVHLGALFSLGKQGGWALELQGLYLFGALATALLGAGRYSLGGRAGRWN